MGIPIKIVGGTQPSGTISITENGKHNVARYAMADVNVSGSAQETYEATIMFIMDGGRDLQEAIEGIVLYRQDSSSEPIVVERVDDTEIPIQLPAGGCYEIEIDGEDYDPSLPPVISAGFLEDEDFFSVRCGGVDAFYSFVMPAHDIDIAITGHQK